MSNKLNGKNIVFIDNSVTFARNMEEHLKNHPDLNYLNAKFNKKPLDLDLELHRNEMTTLETMLNAEEDQNKNYLITTENSAEGTLILATLAQNEELASKIRKIILLCFKYEPTEFEELKNSEDGQEILGFIKDKIELLTFDEEGINGFAINQDIEEVKKKIDNFISTDSL